MIDFTSIFADQVLKENRDLDRLIMRLEDRWLFPVAEAFSRLGCLVRVDLHNHTLTVQRNRKARATKPA